MRRSCSPLPEKAGPLRVRATPIEDLEEGTRGWYRFDERLAAVDGKLDNAVHEYVHHLQATLPGFQRIFRQEHIRRTTLQDGAREPLLHATHDGKPLVDATYRKDDYIDGYMGRDYQVTFPGAEGNPDLSDGDGLELPTRGYQYLFHPFKGEEERLGDMAKKDPGLLDLLLGVLFEYDP